MKLSHPNGRPLAAAELAGAQCGDWFYGTDRTICVVLGWTPLEGHLVVCALTAEGLARDFDWRIGTSVWDRIEVGPTLEDEWAAWRRQCLGPDA